LIVNKPELLESVAEIQLVLIHYVVELSSVHAHWPEEALLHYVDLGLGPIEVANFVAREEVRYESTNLFNT
jgi:hypothetical protein